jgi:hypothetical protein
MDAVQPKIKIYCAVPTTGTVVDAQSYFWREAEKLYGDKIEFIWPEHCVRRIFHDYARNGHVEDFLKSNADILFFLDSDVVPPPSLFDIVLEHDKWKLAGAPYPIFMTPAGVDHPVIMFTAYKGKKKNGLGAADVPSEGKEFVDGLATGCLFIKREILENLPKPYFSFKFDEQTRGMTAGEDLSFCQRMNELGHKFYVDYSKVAKHYKQVCLLDMNNYAMDYAKRSVESYATMIKPMFDELSTRIREKSKKPSGLVAPSGKPLDSIIQRFRA